MTVYDIAFAEKLAQIAKSVVDDGIEDLASQRAVLYLSHLSTEISLKAMLEQAGKPTAEIRRRSHGLVELLKDLSQCEIEVEVGPGVRTFASAARLRACTLKEGDGRITIGDMIDNAAAENASQYPNEIRYGDQLRHYPPEVAAQMARTVAAFARDNWHTLRVK